MKIILSKDAFKFKPSRLQWLRDIWTGIKNLAYWFPVIWHDRGWDRSFLITMLHRKIAQMHKVFVWYDKETWRNHTDSHRIKQLLIARVLLERLDAPNWHHDNSLGPVLKKWGDPEIQWIQLENGNYQMGDWIFPNAKTRAENKQANMEYSKWNRHAFEQEQLDWQFLCDWMKKYAMGWWD